MDQIKYIFVWAYHYGKEIENWLCPNPFMKLILQRSNRFEVIHNFPSYGEHIDGLAQNCRNSSALATELLQSRTKPSVCSLVSRYWYTKLPVLCLDTLQIAYLLKPWWQMNSHIIAAVGNCPQRWYIVMLDTNCISKIWPVKIWGCLISCIRLV